ncbi:hypothetical protein AN396_11695 [Candidatus Epulonipiscium fishelsonii]|uniref:Uncharacterized protein n=1 Tax=Candidatus Epulonipiscium fishelsonii TaxID=77094 RepID=A0ACC8X8K6_9FIRM|nr:hypothetical protein AN396_11695 [Epulopiscium sp. SCG-B11WGA-EpuloA1]
MKILFVTHYAGLYGANLSLLNLIKDLKKRYKAEPIVLLPRRGPLCKVLDKENIEYIVSYHADWRVNNNREGIYGIEVALKWIIARSLNKPVLFPLALQQLNKENIDLIHSNSSVTYIGSYLSKKLNIPHIWHLREYGKPDYNLKFVYPLKYVKRIFNQSKSVIVISKSIYKYYSPIISKNILKLIYNGIDIRDYNKIFISHQNIQFCIVGGISKEKNQLEILKATKILKERGLTNFKLHLIGNGSEKYIKELKHFIKTNHLQQFVRWWDYQENVQPILKKMDVGIMSSKKEAFGRVTIEYMANYMPVIATSEGANPELVINNFNGFLYKVGNAKELSNNMEKLITNPKMIETLGNNAFNWANENFNMEKNTYEIYKLYRGAK